MLKSIIRMERSSTKGSGSPMWRCTTDDGEKVNAFRHQTPSKNTFRFFEAAGYGPVMLDMVEGQIMEWKNHPIIVNLTRASDPKYWDIVYVDFRPQEAVPDPDYKPNVDLMRIYARQWAHLLTLHAPVYLDTETTGTDGDAEITQIGIIDHRGRALFNTYVMPERPERLLVGSPSPADKTGITPEFLAEQKPPTFPELYDTLRTLLAGKIWVIYNAKFDVQMLHQVCLRHNLVPIAPAGVNCAMELAATWRGEWDYVYRRFVPTKLEVLAAACGITADDAHDALADVIMTRDLIHYIGDGRPVPTIEPTPAAQP